MREARNFVAAFSPASFDEFAAVAMAFDSKESAYLRQVFSYWEMVASLIIHGTVNAALAYDNTGEMYFVYAKIQPFIEPFRQKMGAPEFFKNVQKIVEGTPEGRQRIADTQKRMAEFARMRPAAAKKSA